MRQPTDTRRPITPAALMPFRDREEEAPPIEETRPREDPRQAGPAVRFWHLHFGKPYPKA